MLLKELFKVLRNYNEGEICIEVEQTQKIFTSVHHEFRFTKDDDRLSFTPTKNFIDIEISDDKLLDQTVKGVEIMDNGDLSIYLDESLYDHLDPYITI